MRIESDRYVVYLPTGDLAVARSQDEALRILKDAQDQSKRIARHRAALIVVAVAWVLVTVVELVLHADRMGWL